MATVVALALGSLLTAMPSSAAAAGAFNRQCRANLRSMRAYTRTRASSPVASQGGAVVQSAWSQSAQTTVVC